MIIKGKMANPGEIPVEMIVALGEEGVDLVWSIVDKIYETGELPEDMLKSVFYCNTESYRNSRLQQASHNLA